MKILFLVVIVILTITCLALHFSVIADLKEVTEDMNTCYDQFSDHMEVLAETLQVYHELLDGYQIPLIPLPEKKNDTDKYSDW